MKPIPGFDGYYATSTGEVFSMRSSKVLKSVDARGYRAVTIKPMGKRAYVHRLVCAAYHGAPADGGQCNHKNGRKDDNRPENLEWVNRSENMRHAYRELGRPAPNGGAKAVHLIGADGSAIAFPGYKAAADAIGVNNTSVRKAALNNSRCRGYEVRHV